MVSKTAQVKFILFGPGNLKSGREMLWLINYVYYTMPILEHSISSFSHLRHLGTCVRSLITLGVRCISGLLLCAVILSINSSYSCGQKHDSTITGYIMS